MNEVLCIIKVAIGDIYSLFMKQKLEKINRSIAGIQMSGRENSDGHGGVEVNMTHGILK